MITIISAEQVRLEYNRLLDDEQKVTLRQYKRDNRKFDSSVWIVHDKDTGEVIACGDTKTMAAKRARAVIVYPKIVARKNSWLDLDKYSLQEWMITNG